MSEPQGPYSPSVYYRRRAVAAGGVVVALLLGVWGIGALASGNTGPVRNSGNAGPDGSAVLMTTRPSVPSNPPSPSGRPSGSSTTSPPPSSQPAMLTTTVAPPPPPQPCPANAIGVAALVDHPSYAVGSEPHLTLTITDTGPVPCLGDIDRPLRQLVVTTTNGTRLWSSNDCYQNTGGGTVLLQPGKPVEFGITWAGRTSDPGCAPSRGPVGRGTYTLIGNLGPITSRPTPFTLT